MDKLKFTQKCLDEIGNTLNTCSTLLGNYLELIEQSNTKNSSEIYKEHIDLLHNQICNNRTLLILSICRLTDTNNDTLSLLNLIPEALKKCKKNPLTYGYLHKELKHIETKIM